MYDVGPAIKKRATRAKDDYYPTPPAVTEALLRVETFPHTVHEPACGDGAISRVLMAAGHSVISTDLVDHGFGISGRDFLMQTERRTEATALVTNPPFLLADEFAIHALSLGYSHVALFGRLAWLEGEKRRRRLWSAHPPSRVWVFSKRQTLWRGDEANPGKGGALAFAWMVWQRGHAGTQMGWI
jgi:hypothetical protein